MNHGTNVELTDGYLETSFLLLEGQAEFVRDTLEGIETHLPPDLPTRLRRVRLWHMLRQLSPERKQEILSLARNFAEACPAYTDEDFSRADFISLP